MYLMKSVFRRPRGPMPKIPTPYNDFRLSKGYLLVEVLVALALFGMAAVYLVDGAFVAARFTRHMKDTREMEPVSFTQLTQPAYPQAYS